MINQINKSPKTNLYLGLRQGGYRIAYAIILLMKEKPISNINYFFRPAKYHSPKSSLQGARS